MIEAFHAAMTVIAMDVVIDELQVNGNDAHVLGTYSESVVLPDRSSQQFTGRFLHIWRRLPDGSWRLARAVGN